ncbi:MAG: ribonucleoprotein [Thermoprotei archaeon]|nr:MAG: ribonucleoprotein [Thermoprotei archaeon]
MSIQNAVKNLITELVGMLDSKVIVKLVDGTYYEGRLRGIDVGDRLTLHLILEDAKSSDGNIYHKVFISGLRVSEIISVEKPLFDPEEFAALVQQKLNLPPGTIKVFKEAKMVIVYDRYKITENGVEGAGGLASKLYSVWQEYMEEKKKKSG